MLGILLITIKNGRGVITYGANSPKVYNMRYALFTIIIFILCSVSVFSDLEVYPGISLEDQRSDLSNGKFISLFEERRWHDKENWPRLQQEYFGSGQNQPKFNARIAESFKKIRDMLNKQTKELKEKVHNSMKNFAIPEHNSQDFNTLLNDKLDHYKLSNQQILEDVRPYPQENSDFSFNDYNNEESDNMLNDVYSEGVRDTSYYIDGSNDKDLIRKQIFYDPKLSDSTNFAYSPSDPRFYEDLTYPENMVQREVFSNGIDEFNGQSQNILEDGDVNRISYTGAYQEIMDDPRERTDNSVKVVAVQPNSSKTDTAGVYIIAVVAGISAAATVGLIAFTIGWYNLQKHVKNASDVEYPAYGITGPNKEISPSGDRRLAQSAQMYHYQHQKQQIIAMERGADNERRGSVSEADSDEENEEGDYTVYEYAGLAPIGEMEVKNPLFQDEPTPAQATAIKSNENISKK